MFLSVSRLIFILTNILVLNVFLAGSLYAQMGVKPLLMEGKRTLFQRVLTIPEAKLYNSANASSKSSDVVPFSVFYVYQREGDWLKVGSDSFGQISGWVQSQHSIVWNQALTVSFKDPQDSQRVMMFRDKNLLQKMVKENDQEGHARLYLSVVNDELVPNNPVVAISPEAHVDIRENFLSGPYQTT